MRPLTDAELLAVWDQGAHRSLVERAVLLLQAAGTGDDPQNPAQLSIGDRDARLLQLREWMFGSRLQNIADCPACGERMEWVNEVSDLRSATGNTLLDPYFSLQVDAFTIRFRLPNSYDVSRASSEAAYRSNPRKLLTDCILDAQKEASGYQAHDLPDEVLDKLSQQMALEDPQADVKMNVCCPACSYTWDLQFDIVHYLWTEIHNRAIHILQDVVALASAFGWSEPQILQLSPRRRRLYLDIVRK